MGKGVEVERRAAVHTLGCRLNQSESQLIADRLRSIGYTIVDIAEPVDVAIINTCTVTREADGKCRKAIRGVIARNPEAFVAVIGCYSQMGAAEIAAIPGVDLIVGNHDKFVVLDHLEEQKPDAPLILRERISSSDFSLTYVGDLPFDQRANLKVQDGCDFMCSFCVIPFARGRARSRDWDNTIAEANAAVERGVRELVLTGVNIGTYDNGGHDLVDLVDTLASVDGLLRLRISSIEPTTVDERLLRRMADSSHCLLPYLHLPLQSGSDAVLQAMRRKYDFAEYAAFARKAMEVVPDLCLGTDIMVGFDGESEADFEETCKRFLELPFVYCHVFPYSEREGTLALRRERTIVSIEERNRRCARLRHLSARKRHAFMQAHIGRTAEVLLEDPRDGGFPGYTSNYIRVRVEHSAEDIRNRLVLVRLVRVCADWMEAELLDFLDNDIPAGAELRPATPLQESRAGSSGVYV